MTVSGQAATTSGGFSQPPNEEPTPATNTIQTISYSSKVGENYTSNSETTAKLVDDSYVTCYNYINRNSLTSRMSTKLQLVETTNKTVTVTITGNRVFSCGHVVVYTEDISSCMASTTTECKLQRAYSHTVSQLFNGLNHAFVYPACEFSCSCFDKCSNIYIDHIFIESTITSAVCKIAI